MLFFALLAVLEDAGKEISGVSGLRTSRVGPWCPPWRATAAVAGCGYSGAHTRGLH